MPHKHQQHPQHPQPLVVAVKFKPNHVLALLLLGAHVAIFALQKNVAWSVKLTNQEHRALVKQHLLLRVLNLAPVLLHLAVLLMLVVAVALNQRIIVILHLVKTKANQHVSRLQYPLVKAIMLHVLLKCVSVK
jgi:hypothetical protein